MQRYSLLWKYKTFFGCHHVCNNELHLLTWGKQESYPTTGLGQALGVPGS
jgi:hypothetical protein